MSREIKFRAWDKKMRRFINMIDCVTLVKDINNTNNCEFQQFTGLQDKNGKDIYEGDVVLCPSGTLSDIRDVEIEGEVYKAYKPNPPIQYVISNMGYAFFLGTLEKPDYAGVLNHQHNKMHYDLEVIGNIYENPELLEK